MKLFKYFISGLSLRCIRNRLQLSHSWYQASEQEMTSEGSEATEKTCSVAQWSIVLFSRSGVWVKRNKIQGAWSPGWSFLSVMIQGAAIFFLCVMIMDYMVFYFKFTLCNISLWNVLLDTEIHLIKSPDTILQVVPLQQQSNKVTKMYCSPLVVHKSTAGGLRDVICFKINYLQYLWLHIYI